MMLNFIRVCSSVVERYVDIVEVISSILSHPPNNFMATDQKKLIFCFKYLELNQRHVNLMSHLDTKNINPIKINLERKR